MSSSISVFPHGTPWVIALGTSSAGSYYICLSQGCSRMAHFHLLPSSNLIFHFPSGQKKTTTQSSDYCMGWGIGGWGGKRGGGGARESPSGQDYRRVEQRVWNLQLMRDLRSQEP